MSEISRADVEHLAKLAHIAMTDAELEKMTSELGVIVDSVKQVQEAAGADVPATSHPLPLTNVFREDVVGHVFTAEESLANAPDAEDSRFKVPAILDGE
ncbi:Asp-tRNA(Asn)/Glu-tRNA(Gln) amidotransferase subunit GatC [Nesterenkonia alkaliphila]|uniref:Aspartyl/glutamyl-tRNA(Asn/Gln) amidotransferase subunit C n=1 Tax=Nesterenkonia alkaliphila TaxID=1463631 RepID=A0A7K1UK37_9MICC|nr:Asp-tRNA(Asn)/Glu-tRNA(Gln) amidotransferase subunit GatC [Nesterenkonia alkaliphila]MVT26774.1 Asp-tRNA(Asn)/Glu-tRNA(Gln) amidotransferase subunit GatC [Nesterenkonia alkaliphila]GFZ77302.1 aspartyl/glutamyl-tRNA(Asn/Gln) amidotransferase subunit C [Nesterenkonia alkaliphila]